MPFLPAIVGERLTMHSPWEIVLFVFFLCCSAFFSATESAFFSLSPLRLRKLEDEGDTRASSLLKIVSDKQRLLIALLLGNTLVNVSASALATRFILDVFAQSDWLRDSVVGNSPALAITVASILMTVILLFCGEIVPKTIAIFNALAYARVAVFPLQVFLVLSWPVYRVIVVGMNALFPGYSDINKKLGSASSMDEIDSYFSLGEEVGIIEREEKEMISSVFEFGETLVREVMVPRPDIVAVPSNMALEPLLKLIREDGHSRFPVYEGGLDKVLGILYVKDFLTRYEELQKNFDLGKLLRPVYFVPETKKLDDLLREFQKRKLHMAVVVDEFGGVSGLVTLEDLLEEIVGEITDEYDQDEQTQIATVSPGVFSVDARLSIQDLEEEMELSFEYEDSETVGGFVLEKLGRIPRKDERVEDPAATFIVSEVKGNRILRVRVVRKEPVPQARSESRS